MLLELLTNATPPFATEVASDLPIPLDSLLANNAENVGTLRLYGDSVDEVISLKMVRLPPTSSPPFSFIAGLPLLINPNLGILGAAESFELAFIFVLLETSLNVTVSFFSAPILSPSFLPPKGVEFSNGFAKKVAFGFGVSAASVVSFFKPNTNGGALDVIFVWSIAVAAGAITVLALVVATAVGFTPKLKTGLTTVADAGLDTKFATGFSTPNLIASEVVAPRAAAVVTPLFAPKTNSVFGAALKDVNVVVVVVVVLVDGSLGAPQDAHLASSFLFCIQQPSHFHLSLGAFWKFFHKSLPPVMDGRGVTHELPSGASAAGVMLFLDVPHATHFSCVFWLRTKHSLHSHVSEGALNLSPQLEAKGSTDGLEVGGSATSAFGGAIAFTVGDWRFRRQPVHRLPVFLDKHSSQVQSAVVFEVGAFGSTKLLAANGLLHGTLTSPLDFLVEGDFFGAADFGVCFEAVFVLLRGVRFLFVVGVFLGDGDDFWSSDGADSISSAVSVDSSSSFWTKLSNSNGFEKVNISVTSNLGKFDIFNSAFGNVTGVKGLSSNLLSFFRFILLKYSPPLVFFEVLKKRPKRVNISLSTAEESEAKHKTKDMGTERGSRPAGI